MAVPANCNNCANDPSIQDGGQEAQVNLGVVVGVLGGMWLVGVVVLIVVPLVRRRNRRRARDIMRSKGDIDSGYQPSRRSSFRHQKMFSGPDAHVLLPLLDPLRPVSTLTWSDLHSRSLSIDSTDGGDTYVSPTNNATTSHRSPGEQPPVMDEEKRVADGTRSSPPSKRSPTPPGLPSKRESRTARRASLPLTPTTPIETGPRDRRSMHLVPAAISDSISRNSSRHRAVVQRPGMEPVMEDGTDLYATSLQLPSPPASPNQSQRDWRTNTSTRRPSLTGSQAAPTSLPFRPRSSTGPSFPLTSAFQTSMLRSGMQSTPHTSTTQRYPSITTSPPPHEPSRSGSALLSSNPQVESVTKTSRPVDPFRRLSTTDIRHRHPLQASAEPSASPPSSEQRAFLYPPESLRKPQYQEAGGSSSHRQGTSVSGSIHPSQSQSSHTRSSADTTRTGPSMVVSNQQQSHVQQQQQPALVKRKDSLALRPLPLSSFLHSPPHSPPSGPTARSRSNSVRTERSLPVYIPPLDPIPPLNFEHKYSPEDPEQKEGSQRKLKP